MPILNKDELQEIFDNMRGDKKLSDYRINDVVETITSMYADNIELTKQVGEAGTKVTDLETAKSGLEKILGDLRKQNTDLFAQVHSVPVKEDEPAQEDEPETVLSDTDLFKLMKGDE